MLFGFIGKPHHDDLVYLRARWYAPGQGRFVSKDPFAGFPEMPYSLHAYQYAYSNPVMWTDPTGMYGDRSCKLPPGIHGPPACPRPEYVHPYIYSLLPNNTVYMTALEVVTFNSEILDQQLDVLEAERSNERLLLAVEASLIGACGGLIALGISAPIAAVFGAGVSLGTLGLTMPDEALVDPKGTLAAIETIRYMQEEIRSFTRYINAYTTPPGPEELPWVPYMAFYVTRNPAPHIYVSPDYKLHTVQVVPEANGGGSHGWIRGMEGVDVRHSTHDIEEIVYRTW
jgi:RHS repeat-associated protein